MRRLYVFDTTLRDGEQSLGITLNADQKLEIARQLVRLGVDVIEAGFPASSPGDLEAVRRIGAEVKGVAVCALSRAVRSDIDACAEALKTAESPRIHTGIATSPIHMERKLRKTPEQVLEMAVDAVRYAKRFVSDVEFYAEDAFRSDREFLRRVFAEVIKAGATVINIPDTVGYASPWEYGELISWCLENIEEMDRVTISVHCHNDLGMATANSLAGIRAGATQVEGTINGIGERAGNTALEEVIMAIYSHRESYGIEMGINIKEIARTSQLVSMVTGVPVPPFKAIVGSNAYSHASGIHQDGVLKDRSTYEIIKPEDVGFASNRIVLTNRSGRHALKAKLAEMGYALSPEEIDSVYKKFLEVADAKSHVTDEDLAAIVQGKPVHVREERVKLKSLQASTGGVVSASGGGAGNRRRGVRGRRHRGRPGGRRVPGDPAPLRRGRGAGRLLAAGHHLRRGCPGRSGGAPRARRQERIRRGRRGRGRPGRGPRRHQGVGAGLCRCRQQAARGGPDRRGPAGGAG